MKNYVYPECRIVMMEETDIIATSSQGQLEREDYVVFNPSKYNLG